MAFTATKRFETILGNKIFGCYRLTGDASDTTWSAPVETLDGVWMQPYFGTGYASAGTSLCEFTFTGNDITFIATPAASELIDVFYIGV